MVTMLAKYLAPAFMVVGAAFGTLPTRRTRRFLMSLDRNDTVDGVAAHLPVREAESFPPTAWADGDLRL